MNKIQVRHLRYRGGQGGVAGPDPALGAGLQGQGRVRGDHQLRLQGGGRRGGDRGGHHQD